MRWGADGQLKGSGTGQAPSELGSQLPTHGPSTCASTGVLPSRRDLDTFTHAYHLTLMSLRDVATQVQIACDQSPALAGEVTGRDLALEEPWST